MKIAIVGGGVAGTTTALYLGELGLDVTLFEKDDSLISGPPFCHLHAGGNLYPDISDEQCLKLLEQSIDFAKFYPQIIDHRPTLITFPKSCTLTPQNLLSRLEKLQQRYEILVKEDKTNQVLKESKEYFKLYTRDDLEKFKRLDIPLFPKESDEWMISASKFLDLDSINYPVILVQEYGLNLFRLSSLVSLGLDRLESVKVLKNSVVTNVSFESNIWQVEYKNKSEIKIDRFDYLINAAGFRTGVIDDMIGIECKKMVEFKAAYVTKWSQQEKTIFPEIIFHGKRGTPKGMGQFTPYPNGHFQLHGMTEEITLYKDGLVKSSRSCQPKLSQDFINKIEKSWNSDEVELRTKRAIKHISRYIPSFIEAKTASKPLYGAQQIPGDDPTLRVAEVAFPTKRYARCEIVKVSSVFDMADEILKDLKREKLILDKIQRVEDFKILKEINEQDIANLTKKIAISRGYPSYLSQRVIPN